MWLTSRKKITPQKQTRFSFGSLEIFLLREIMWLIFVWLTFTLSFRTVIVKNAAKQTIWFLACWFFKHDIWTCCERLWLNVIIVWIAAVFLNLVFFLTLISFAGMDFQKFSSFFQVVGLSTFGDEKFLQNTQKMWFYLTNDGETFRVYYKFSKKHSRKFSRLFYPISTVFYCFFQV